MSNNDQWVLEKVSDSSSIAPAKPKENILDYKKMNEVKTKPAANTLDYKEMNKPKAKPAEHTLDYSKFNDPKPKSKELAPHEALSDKWNGKVIPKGHEDHGQMINHVNKLHQQGNVKEASRMYDMHVIGGGTYTKGLKKCLETLKTVFKELNASD